MKYQSDQLKRFSEQIDFVIQNYTGHNLSISDFNNIILGGLGGSGIGGRIAKVLFRDRLSIPVEVVSDYALPAFAGSKTLVILSSYSGNTEETLSLFEDARNRGCKIIVITTGGRLEELAADAGAKIYGAVPGYQPRMALGFPLTTLLLIFGELAGEDLKAEMKAIASKVSNTENYIAEGRTAFEPFEHTIGKKFIIIADEYTEPIALRLCQQIQENAKGESFYIVVPESNHNVIETFYGSFNTNFIFLQSNKNQRVKLRFEFLRNLFRAKKYSFSEYVVHNFSIESCLETIYIFDWFSLWLADAKKQNSIGIANINALKNFLEENS